MTRARLCGRPRQIQGQSGCDCRRHPRIRRSDDWPTATGIHPTGSRGLREFRPPEILPRAHVWLHFRMLRRCSRSHRCLVPWERRSVLMKGDGARGYQQTHPPSSRENHRTAVLPGLGCARFTTGMRQLDSGDGALGPNECGDPGERRDMVVLPEGPGRPVRSGRTLFDRRRVGDYERGAADSPAAQVTQVPVGGKTVFAGVLAHRRYGNSIAEI